MALVTRNDKYEGPLGRLRWYISATVKLARRQDSYSNGENEGKADSTRVSFNIMFENVRVYFSYSNRLHHQDHILLFHDLDVGLHFSDGLNVTFTS